jgi:voltage-gated potassium channel
MAKMNVRDRIHEIIFEADTRWGKAFDVALLIAIVMSVVVVSLESVSAYQVSYGRWFFYLEWTFTLLFSVEYLLRLYSVKQWWRYAFSFYGIVDLLSILPTFLSLFVAGTQYLITIRALRLLRVFRIFKLANYLTESYVLLEALQASRVKISIFLGAVLTVVTFVGSTMYLVEAGADSGFTSIPRSIYWAIVTVTTVGYGDIAPATPLGQFLSAVLMILGYGVIAVPTGIVSIELAQAHESVNRKLNTRTCPNCARSGHDSDATYCKYCAEAL